MSTSAAAQIARGIITITVEGLEKIQARLDVAKKNVRAFTDAASAVGNKAFGYFAAGTATITGLLRAADPVGFEKFGVALQVLSLHIGRTFIPLLRAATDKVNEWIVYWKTMDNATRENILSWVKWIGGGLLAVGVFSKLLAIATPVLGLVSNLTTVTIGLFRAMAPLAAPVLSAAGAFYQWAKSMSVTEAMNGLWSVVVRTGSAIKSATLATIEWLSTLTLTGVVEGMKTAVMGLGKAFLVAFGNPIVLAIAAVVAALAIGLFKMHALAEELDKFADNSKRLQGGVNAKQAKLKDATANMTPEEKERYLQQQEQEARQRSVAAGKAADEAQDSASNGNPFKAHANADLARQKRKEADEAEEDRRAALQEREDTYRKKAGLKALDKDTRGNGGRFNPELRMAAPQITGIAEVWKKIQQSDQQDPNLRYQRELLEATQNGNDKLDTIAQNTGKGQVARAG